MGTVFTEALREWYLELIRNLIGDFEIFRMPLTIFDCILRHSVFLPLTVVFEKRENVMTLKALSTWQVVLGLGMDWASVTLWLNTLHTLHVPIEIDTLKLKSQKMSESIRTDSVDAKCCKASWRYMIDFVPLFMAQTMHCTRVALSYQFGCNHLRGNLWSYHVISWCYSNWQVICTNTSTG